jgi:hypothetical protein
MRKTIIISIAFIILIVLSFYAGNVKDYTLETKNLSAQQVVEYYFKSWNHKNGLAMRAVMSNKNEMAINDYWIRQVNYVKILTIKESPTETKYIKTLISDPYYAVTVFSVTFDVNYPKNVVTGYNGKWDLEEFELIKKTKNSPWLIGSHGFF